MLVGRGAEEGFASPGFEDTVGCELPIEVLCKVRVWPSALSHLFSPFQSIVALLLSHSAPTELC